MNDSTGGLDRKTRGFEALEVRFTPGEGRGGVRLPGPGWRAVPLANVGGGCLVRRRRGR